MFLPSVACALSARDVGAIFRFQPTHIRTVSRTGNTPFAMRCIDRPLLKSRSAFDFLPPHQAFVNGHSILCSPYHAPHQLAASSRRRRGSVRTALYRRSHTRRTGPDISGSGRHPHCSKSGRCQGVIGGGRRCGQARPMPTGGSSDPRLAAAVRRARSRPRYASPPHVQISTHREKPHQRLQRRAPRLRQTDGPSRRKLTYARHVQLNEPPHALPAPSPIGRAHRKTPILVSCCGRTP